MTLLAFLTWQLVFDKFLGGIITFLLMLAPTIVIWMKSKAAENEARAARIQGEINAHKADAAAQAAVVAKSTATQLASKLDENTQLTQEIREQINGITEERVAGARAQGKLEGIQEGKSQQ